MPLYIVILPLSSLKNVLKSDNHLLIFDVFGNISENKLQY